MQRVNQIAKSKFLRFAEHHRVIELYRRQHESSKAASSRSRWRIYPELRPAMKASRIAASWFWAAVTALKLHSALNVFNRCRQFRGPSGELASASNNGGLTCFSIIYAVPQKHGQSLFWINCSNSILHDLNKALFRKENSSEQSHGRSRMTMTNTKVRTQTKECTASNQRAQLLRFRELIATIGRSKNFVTIWDVPVYI